MSLTKEQLEELTQMGIQVVFAQDDKPSPFDRPPIPITRIPDEHRNYHPVLIEDSGKPYYHSAPNKGNRKNQRKKKR